jgi:hypothetical protein
MEDFESRTYIHLVQQSRIVRFVGEHSLLEIELPTTEISSYIQRTMCEETRTKSPHTLTFTLRIRNGSMSKADQVHEFVSPRSNRGTPNSNSIIFL